MKITVDKRFTAEYQRDQVKADIAEFKARYTDRDVLDAFQAQSDCWKGWSQDIIRCNAEALPAGAYYGDVTVFSFEILLESEVCFVKIRCWLDMDLNLFGENSWKVKEYRAF